MPQGADTSLREGVSCFGQPKPRGRVRRVRGQEALNGQESAAKQPRAEEAQAGEAEANGWAIGLHYPARAAGGTNAHEEEVRSGALRSEGASAPSVPRWTAADWKYPKIG